MEHLIFVDRMIVACLFPLAVWILFSGLDDLVLDVVCCYHWLIKKRTSRLPAEEDLCRKPESKIAILVPLWQEHRVIRKMIEHNTSAIRYRSHHFFIGAYPNDPATLTVVQDLEDRYPNVHLAVVPNDGPTSKADCLNAIYDHLVRFEQQSGTHFAVVMTHDAEDLIHPDSLRWVNYYSDTHDMVQTPVLPLSTPWWKLTHGVYCDEFCESHTRDMRARQFTGSFIPSCGVGTSFSRASLEQLAVSKGNRIFEPACLTEDYENGLSLHLLGATQIFIPLSFRNGSFVATREYFPLTFRGAVKQRTRWVMGISLQGWERHGWQGGLVAKYWLWRDRKGLVGNPLSLLTNLICLYGVGTWIAAAATGAAWGLGHAALPAHFAWLFGCTSTLGIGRIFVRIFCTGRVYGWLFALLVPVRTFYANLINSAATVCALYRYTSGRMKKSPHTWLKTDHTYPTQTVLSGHKRLLGEMLTAAGLVTEEQLRAALATKPEQTRLGWHLVKLKFLTEAQLYQAVSQQQCLQTGRVAPQQVNPNVARGLPWDVIRTWRVMPFKVETGSLFVAGPGFPTEEMQRDLKKYTSLEVRFQLITPANFAELTSSLL
ncbi:MAG: glycosyl transferase family protein [Bryobacteraceae bacterium]